MREAAEVGGSGHEKEVLTRSIEVVSELHERRRGLTNWGGGLITARWSEKERQRW